MLFRSGDGLEEKSALVVQLAVRAQRDLLLAERILDTMETPAEQERREKKRKKGS